MINKIKNKKTTILLNNNLYLSFTIINISTIIIGDFKKKNKIGGLICNHCTKAVVIKLKKLRPDSLSVKIWKAEIEYDHDKLYFNDILNGITKAG